ncbi:hypothetical protein ACL9RL_03080 [Plantibacter sp. Mn2098]|uniref:hypothetical protein n=1 Tax=Plantibacter sp. Mn2098 TaxID=3395266 RepID=UPI003BC8F688
MVDLKLDLDQLGSLAADLKSVSKTFTGTEISSDVLSQAVGHDGLAGKIQAFANKWDDKRVEMTERVDTVARTVQAIHDAFIEVDKNIAATAPSNTNGN